MGDDPTTDDLRTVGVLGGTSSESTVAYYRGIDRGINDALGGHAAGDLVIRSVNFADVERFVRTGRWDRADEYLADAARDLETAGADFVVMATNTMHRVAPAITDAIDDLSRKGAEGIVLGCTEVELLIEQRHRPDLPMFDTTALHVERAVELSLGASDPDPDLDPG